MATVPRDITDRIKDLERAVRELSGAANRSPALTAIKNGPVVVSGPGSLDVVDASGRLRVRIGVQAGDKTLQVWDAAGTLVLSQ
ncbi:hypothetical protein HOS58_gp19 [Streptomyces phage Attoomi]|uniref:Uncharacterized protein n=1 Tax=Streptomyces phage Attoomi TaxID=2059881 RepID=A0A2H5BLJ1_9CAUD|nr:hypothetical protein HOS58_gp19 [Streptomyces phage Attoomi]AUG87151.1 hypothetical protein SEA_ATTOOMI_19 [Streptomyces phage Attoomi]